MYIYIYIYIYLVAKKKHIASFACLFSLSCSDTLKKQKPYKNVHPQNIQKRFQKLSNKNVENHNCFWDGFGSHFDSQNDSTKCAFCICSPSWGKEVPECPPRVPRVAFGSSLRRFVSICVSLSIILN